MKFKNPFQSATERVISQEAEYKLYEKVASDIEKNDFDKGVWTKAFSKAEGNESKQKAIYIELMVDHYKDLIKAGEEFEEILRKRAEQESKEQIRRKAKKREKERIRKQAEEDEKERIKRNELYLREEEERRKEWEEKREEFTKKALLPYAIFILIVILSILLYGAYVDGYL